jgi:SpoVK/Ycf46/Vps4 family AAA+-type ATPase
MGQGRSVLQTLIACGQVWLAGPAGSGKTSIAEALAKALGLPFFFNGAIDSPYKLAGFIDAQGRIIRPAFRQAYENGGVYLFDEVDASMPAAVLAFNSAMSNGKYDFPDGTVERHKDFYCVAAANTFGLGASDDYVGRMKQDAAFLDRFPSIYLDYDEALENAIAGNADWVSYVQSCRRVARSRGLRVVISPRASIFGSKLLAAGMARERVAELAIRKGMNAEHWQTIQSEVAA